MPSISVVLGRPNRASTQNTSHKRRKVSTFQKQSQSLLVTHYNDVNFSSKYAPQRNMGQSSQIYDNVFSDD